MIGYINDLLLSAAGVAFLGLLLVIWLLRLAFRSVMNFMKYKPPQDEG